jgi:amino-acid N-acetyltransferase
MVNTNAVSSPVRPSAADLSAVLALLDAAGLPTADVGVHFGGFFVVRDAHRVFGVVGVEVYGDTALLRSLVVQPQRRGLGLGRRLLDCALAALRARDVRAVYLLTTSAEKFFESHGFERCDRATVPPAIARTSEFASLCPANAVCMRRDLVASCGQEGCQ